LGGISITQIRPASVQSNGSIAVSVPREVVSSRNGFSFSLPIQVTAQTPAGAPIRVALPNGGPLPAWLTFDVSTRTFVAAKVPEGELPIDVAVTIDGVTTIIVISEQAQ
jgi:hypothetical protein